MYIGDPITEVKNVLKISIVLAKAIVYLRDLHFTLRMRSFLHPPVVVNLGLVPVHALHLNTSSGGKFSVTNLKVATPVTRQS